MDRSEQKISVESITNFGLSTGLFKTEKDDYFLTEEARFKLNGLFPIAKEITEDKKYAKKFVEILHNRAGRNLYQKLLDNFLDTKSEDGFAKNFYFNGENFEKIKKLGIDSDIPVGVATFGLVLLVRGLCIDKEYITNTKGIWYMGPGCCSLDSSF